MTPVTYSCDVVGAELKVDSSIHYTHSVAGDMFIHKHE